MDPYLLGGMEITRPILPRKDGPADITYISMARGFHYLVLQGKDGLVHSVRGGLAPIQHPGR